jgi:catechol 2,3-dioxygenase-like lactoylglutathione lyase family enzyme
MRVKNFFKLLAKILAGLVALLACLIIFIMLQPAYTNATQIDFTRHISQYNQEIGDPLVNQDSFFGVPGPARLIVTNSSEEATATIQLNGTELAGPDSFSGAGQFEVPVTLLDNNIISVALNGLPGSSVSVRVKQLADVELHVESRVHFNTNVSDFVAAREFYGKLGFSTLSGFPDTNTQAMARAIGIETPTSYDGSKGDWAGGYLLHGELVGLGGFSGGVIDLIEFTIPRNEEPPYTHINHLGMASAVMHTTNIAADYTYMQSIGVEFISAPTTRSDGTVFAIFTDLDGTHYELVEVEGEDAETATTHFTNLGQVNVNVSDFERSSAWYQLMGYEVSKKLVATDSIEVAKAMGFEQEFEINGAVVTHQSDGSTLGLAQWITPYNPERAYSIPVNHLGIHRMAFATNDIAADVATLKAQGVEFVSPVTPCCSGPESSGSIVAFYDPDGTVVELVEARFMKYIMTVMRWFN